MSFETTYAVMHDPEAQFRIVKDFINGSSIIELAEASRVGRGTIEAAMRAVLRRITAIDSEIDSEDV